MGIHERHRDHDAGNGVDYTEADIERLTAPDCTSEEVGKVISHVRVADDPGSIVDRIAELLYGSQWRQDPSVIEFLLDAATHTLDLVWDASPEALRHIVWDCVTQYPLEWFETIEELRPEHHLEKETLLLLLQHRNPHVRQIGVRVSGGVDRHAG